MTKRLRTFTLTPTIKTFLEKRKFNLECDVCGEPLEIGDLIRSKRKSATSKHKYYHDECWERLFF